MPVPFDLQAFLETPGEGKRLLIFKANTVIFKQGDPTFFVYHLIEGVAKEVVVGDHGREAVTDVLEPGDFFGTAVLAGAPTRVSTVTAMEACRVAALTVEATQHAIAKEPRFVRLFLQYLLTRNSRTEAEKVDLMLNSTENRLARKLVELSHIRTGDNRVINQAIDPNMLADMIGAGHSHVHQFMSRFRKLGLIGSAPGGIRVLPALLRVVIKKEEGEE